MKNFEIIRILIVSRFYIFSKTLKCEDF